MVLHCTKYLLHIITQILLYRNAGTKLLKRMLELQDNVLEKANQYKSMEFLPQSERERLLDLQDHRCNHCLLPFKENDKIVADRKLVFFMNS